MIGADLLRFTPAWTTAIAVLLSAALFAAHHHPPVGSEPFSTAHFLFRTLAGIYLGVLFVWRGYGLAAGTHVAYNVVVVMLTH
jgi:membrane protease YdiL (CAAX protease family)